MSKVNIPSNLPDWAANHLREYLESGGEKGHMMDMSAFGASGVAPCLLLTTTGRRSGQQQILPLIYDELDGVYFVIASKGGSRRHPAWYLNLDANPAVEVQVGTKYFDATARTLGGSERTRYWDAMTSKYPLYLDYQKRTAREIPVVVLEPVSA